MLAVQNNSKKSLILQNLSDILPLFCTPTWPSHHVIENHNNNDNTNDINNDKLQLREGKK